MVFCYTSPNGLRQGIGGLAEFSFFAVSSFCYSPTQYGSSGAKKAGGVPETTLDTESGAKEAGPQRQRHVRRPACPRAVCKPEQQWRVSLRARTSWDSECLWQIERRSTNRAAHRFTRLF